MDGPVLIKEQQDESSFYTVANVPFGFASNLRVGWFSEINKILLYNRGYGVTKRVRIQTEKKSPTNHLQLSKISSAYTGYWLCKTWPGTWSLLKGSTSPPEGRVDAPVYVQQPEPVQLWRAWLHPVPPSKELECPSWLLSAPIRRWGRHNVLNSRGQTHVREVQLPSFHVYQEERVLILQIFDNVFTASVIPNPF